MTAQGPQGLQLDTVPAKTRLLARRLLVAAAVILLTLVGYFRFPGHTYLQSDSQIYLPILEHLRDPSVLQRDLLAQHPHVSFTIYDEVSVGLARLAGADFRQVLALQQLVYRALGILGVYLLATAVGVSTRMALLVAAAFSLGATIGGPTVLTFEYEPVPRGFAIPLSVFALGLAAHGRDLAAGAAATLAFLYHAPAAFAFWAVYSVMTLWPSKPAVMSRRIWGLVPLACGVLVLLVLSRFQVDVRDPQMFFERIGPELEKLQRMRAPYNWVGLWVGNWIGHYLFLWAVSVLAFWRLRRFVCQDLKFFLLGLPLLGMLSFPVSYVLLEKMKWALVPQVQPGRALLFVTALAGILAALAAIKAGQQRRYWESVLWFLLVFAIPMSARVSEILLPGLSDPLARRRALLALLLAVGAALAVWAEASKRRWAVLAWALAVLAPFFAIPGYGKVNNYPDLHPPELRQLADWARSSTPKDAVFLFPDAGKELYPGIFRAQALRAVYVDWKAGGQINYLKAFADEWWPRWQATMQGRFRPEKVRTYAALGIDYIVVRPVNRLPGGAPVFENAKFLVYRLR